jgi:tRNA1Val (adenine37-N6)-methyltransferase
VILHQLPKGGYRTNVDALQLAHFARGPRPATQAFDLGAGVGAIGLALLHWGAAQAVSFVEIDPNASELTKINVEVNGWDSRCVVLNTNVRDAASQHFGSADLIVCNPPYVEPGSGRSPPDAARNRARVGNLQTFTDAARQLAGRRARACFVYPARSLADLLFRLRSSGLEPKRLRAVHPTRDEPARVILVEATASKPGGLVLMSPLIERDDQGYTPELSELLGC